VHDSQVFEELLVPAESNPDIYADSAYRSKETEKRLAQGNYKSHIHERAYRNKPLTDEQKETNRKRSQTRVRVEHVFGSQLQLAGDLLIRTIGIVRAKTKIGLRNLSYNLNRYSLLSSKVVA
jgi:IS5 family transposase